MSSSFPSLPPSPAPPFFTDEDLIFMPASANRTTSEGRSSPTPSSSSSSFPSFLDPFNIFTTPSASTPPHFITSTPPLPLDPPRRKPVSPGSALLVLGGLTGGVSLLSSASTFLLLRGSLARSVTQKIAQGRDTSLEEIRNSLLRVEARMGALEGRIVRFRRGGGGGRGGSAEGEGGGSSSSQVLLRELREEVRALKSELERKGYEREWISAAKEKSGSKRADDVDLRARSPYDFVPPSRPDQEGSAVETPTASSPLPPPPPTTEPFADQLVSLIENQDLEVSSSSQISNQVRLALENKQSKLEAQSARKWKAAFSKGQSTLSPPLVRVSESVKTWENAFKSNKSVEDEVDATCPTEPAREVVADVVSSNLANSESAQVISSSSSWEEQPVRIAAEEENPSSSSDGASSPVETVFPSNSSSIPPLDISTPPADPHIIKPYHPTIPPSSTSLEPHPSAKSTATTTLGKDLDLAASLASRIDSHWYSSTSSSLETSNIKMESQKEKEQPIVDKFNAKGRSSSTSRSRSLPASTAASTPSSSASTPQSPPTPSSNPSPQSPPESTEQQQSKPPTSFHFEAATLLFPPGIGFAGVYSYPPLRGLNKNPSSDAAFKSESQGKEEEEKPARRRRARIVEVVGWEGYDREGVLRSFRRRFL